MSAVQTESPPVSRARLYGILLFLLVSGTLMLIAPLVNFIQLVAALKAQPDEISFDKGVYYLFGGGLTFLLVFLWAAYGLATNKALSKQNEKLAFTALGISLALIFILPIVVDKGVAENLTTNGYVVCAAKSTQWLQNKTIVYLKNKPCE